MFFEDDSELANAKAKKMKSKEANKEKEEKKRKIYFRQNNAKIGQKTIDSSWGVSINFEDPTYQWRVPFIASSDQFMKSKFLICMNYLLWAFIHCCHQGMNGVTPFLLPKDIEKI